MVDQNILEFLKKRNDRDNYPELLNEEIINNPDTVNDVMIGLLSDSTRTRSSYAEIASIISEEHPGKLYPHADIFVECLNSSIPEVRCFAASILGNLASVDQAGIITDQIKLIARDLSNDRESIQASTVQTLSKIAHANPEEAERIFNLLISHKKYFPKERIRVLLQNLEHFSDNKELREDARRFLEYYADNGSKPVQNKALEVLRKFSISG